MLEGGWVLGMRLVDIVFITSSLNTNSNNEQKHNPRNQFIIFFVSTHSSQLSPSIYLSVCLSLSIYLPGVFLQQSPVKVYV